MKIRFPLILIFLISSVVDIYGQISQGGYPIEILNLKSSSQAVKTIIMPRIDFRRMREETPLKENFKSLKFAHSFSVNITPENSGQWFEADGYRIWQTIIKSDSALSLNVIFSKYYIPDGARLFVFDKNKEHILGAFTSFNNKEFKKLGVYPIPGDELVIQYEEPYNAAFKGELEIGEVNHDYLGIFNFKNRWDRRLSEWCHVDVNCEFESGLDKQKHSVCRIIAGDEIGTGTLLNTVLQNGKPYLISAFHIYDSPEVANTSLYDFNYESPFCTGMDGFDIQSVSGSEALAWFDSLDFILVELSETPPATYRPYYSGWDVTKNLPENTYTIHHPNGDVKKISHDSGKCDSTRYSTRFLNNGHWKVREWETGSTEGGSSGAALFNNSGRVVGTLSGGDATCDDPEYDCFARLDRMWTYKSQNNRQLKRWLDPGGTGKLTLDGYDPFKSDKGCDFTSNFVVEDSVALLPDFKSTEGIYSGNNKMNITEVGEIFTEIEKATICGVAVGVAGFKFDEDSPDFTIRIYTGDSLPVFAVKQFKFPMKQLTENAMNYFSFSEPVNVNGNFFISIVIPSGEDSLAIFQSHFRPAIIKNSMLVKQDDIWKKVTDLADVKNSGASLLIQVMLCNSSFTEDVDTIFKADQLFRLFPNPAKNYVVVEFKERAPLYNIIVSDMSGKSVLSDCIENRMYTELSVSSFPPGIYLIKVSNGSKAEIKKFVVTGK